MAVAPLGELQDSLVLEQYAGLVCQIAGKLAARLPSSVSFDDLVQAGRLALVDAAGRYQAELASFETYATIRIRGAMIDEVRKLDWAPRSVHRHERAAAEARRRIEQRSGRPARPTEIADALGMSVEAYHHLVEDAARATVLNIEADELQPGVGSVHPVDRDDPASRLERGEFRGAVTQAIRELPQAEMRVVKLLYGTGLTLEEVSAVLTLTVPRVRRICASAVRHLRERLAAWNGRGDDTPQAPRRYNLRPKPEFLLRPCAASSAPSPIATSFPS